MDIVKYMDYRKADVITVLGKKEEIIEYRFKIMDCIANTIRKYSKSFAENNEFIYRVAVDNEMDFDALHPLFVETLERICNEEDDEFFYNHILTNNGYHRAPSEIHDMMRDECGLADIDKLNELDETAINVEWWVAGFIIDLDHSLFHRDVDDKYFKMV